jgi:hypothetical protein
VHRITWTLCFVLSVGVMSAVPAAANAVAQWNTNAGKAAVAACISPANDPLHESRLYAMMHIAIHDALNAIDRRSRPYTFDEVGSPQASPNAAVAAAARHVLVPVIGAIPFPAPCLQAAIASVEADYAAALAGIPDGVAKGRGIELGEAAAAAIVALRSSDGSDTPLLDFAYPQGNVAGEYRFTPGFDFAFAPGWANVTPFVLNHSAQFRGRAPYGLHTAKYARDFNEVKALGGDGLITATSRTAEQTQIGLFWLESSPLQWNRIARTVAAGSGLGLWESARLFGLLNLALADGYIGSWETKYHYNFWRPVSAIHNADGDGNRETAAEPSWTPLQLTYPIPDHDSAHSVQGGAAAEVLRLFLGRDDIAFSACSFSLPEGSRCSDPAPLLRFYPSFTAAAEENAASRIFVGIHFRHAAEEGIQHGRKIGRRAATLYLKPGN